ncbi:hypothetical protein [Bradyrhizobium sp.]|uniref:hypothetical protein n=1 Tax=Bradyrhizobium sp. TaxID=376 RepID=UPI002CAB1DC5|nr:hypothetical protein [Bradyrhizobium sp.]HMM87977.1 hypothetical protein [Bradyrhizobium sp.]
MLLPVLGGAALAVLLSPSPHPPTSSVAWKTLMRAIAPLRRACLGFGSRVEAGDELLRQWSAAGISLLLLAIVFTTLMSQQIDNQAIRVGQIGQALHPIERSGAFFSCLGVFTDAGLAVGRLISVPPHLVGGDLPV